MFVSHVSSYIYTFILIVLSFLIFEGLYFSLNGFLTLSFSSLSYTLRLSRGVSFLLNWTQYSFIILRLSTHCRPIRLYLSLFHGPTPVSPLFLLYSFLPVSSDVNHKTPSVLWEHGKRHERTYKSK